MSASNAAEPNLLAREVDIALERIAAARAEIGLSFSARSASSISRLPFSSPGGMAS